MTTITTAWGVTVPVPDNVSLHRYAAAADRVALAAFMKGDTFDPTQIEITPADKWAIIEKIERDD